MCTIIKLCTKEFLICRISCRFACVEIMENIFFSHFNAKKRESTESKICCHKNKKNIIRIFWWKSHGKGISKVIQFNKTEDHGILENLKNGKITAVDFKKRMPTQKVILKINDTDNNTNAMYKIIDNILSEYVDNYEKYLADETYKNGKIYKIICDDTDKFYIGSTILPLEKRL